MLAEAMLRLADISCLLNAGDERDRASLSLMGITEKSPTRGSTGHPTATGHHQHVADRIGGSIVKPGSLQAQKPSLFDQIQH